MSMVWLDGIYLPEEKAMIPATDRGFLHGRGLFETLRAYGGVPFRLDDHLARLTVSAAHFKMKFTPPDLDEVVRELCKRNEGDDAAVRITLSGDGRLLVTTKPRKPLPQSWYDRGAEVMVVPFRRDARGLLAGHKVTSHLENVLVHDEAMERGCADALFVGLKGELLEGAVTNIFLVVKGRLVTPKVPGILPGVTRRVVMELIPVKERTVRLKEFWKADEAFLTNALIEVLPIGKPGPVGRKVADLYLRLTRELG
ncbi:MAG TPA: aminotransferase class IV [Planctomycetota bacterium]|nr:aminotransferase class IV [Planctomycetota bacterium]